MNIFLNIEGQIVPSLASGKLCLFDMIREVFYSFTCYIRCSSFTSQTFYLRLISLRSPEHLIEKWYFRTRVWVLEILFFAKLDIFSRTFQWNKLGNTIRLKKKKSHKCILTPFIQIQHYRAFTNHFSKHWNLLSSILRILVLKSKRHNRLRTSQNYLF